MFLYIFLKNAFIGASLIIRQSSGILKINLYEINKQSDNKVLLEVLVSGGRIAIGQIVSTGQASAEGFWYEQKQDDWIALFQGQARLSWDDGIKIGIDSRRLYPHPTREKHRGDYTSREPPFIWLAAQGMITPD
ncbi:MAG: hypothetical protein AVO34_00680 [Firmicutes bacterium ML8_F2]|nr:MAG: hypothetical protein AVO34_00680 [Firmicutes bacterium ML8_F2]